MIKRTRLILFFILFTTGMVFGETVMIYVTEEENYKEKDAGVKRLSYSLEGGIMDEFFERGHIVFNMGPEDNKAGDFRIDEETFPLYLAKSGGASFLLTVYITYRNERSNLEEKDSRMIVSSARYRYFDVEKTETVKTGVLDAGMYFDVNGEADASPEEHSFTVGRLLAQEALRPLQ